CVGCPAVTATRSRRHAQRLAHDTHRPDLPVVLDQAEPHLGGSEKIATAFFKMSRSVRSRLFSRRSREISAARSAAGCGADAGIVCRADPPSPPPPPFRPLRSIPGERPSPLSFRRNAPPPAT